MNNLFTSIKSKIIFLVVMIVGLGFVAFGAYDYQDSQSKILHELNQLADIKVKRLVENIALPLWELDTTWVEKIIHAEMADKHVQATYVYADNKLFLGKEHNSQWQIVSSSQDMGDEHIVRSQDMGDEHIVRSQDMGDEHIVRSQDILFDGEKIGWVRVHITTAFLEQTLQDKLIRDASSLAFLALLITVVLVSFLNQLIARRLEEILDVSQSIATGDYSKIIAVPYHDEVGLLAQGINAMSLKIQMRESELLASEDKFRSLVNNAADAFFLIATEDARLIDVNKAACHNLGYSKEELLKMSVPDIQTKFKTEMLTSMYNTMAIGEIKTLTGEHLRKDGSTFPVEVQLSMIEQDGHRRVIALARDITLRLESESRNRLFSQALEQSGEAVVITDAQGTIEHINPTFTAVTGYTESEVVGQNTSILKSDNQNESFYKDMWENILSGHTWTSKITNKKKDGSLYPAMLTISPIKNEEGDITRFIATQQNLQSYEELEAKFHQAQKMEAIGTLVGGIAHDFNNTLAGIVGNLYLAKKEANSLPHVVNRLEGVEKLSFGAASTIQQLLAFSRKGVVEMSPVSISPFLKETIKLQRIALTENITLNTEINDTDMQVNGDLNQLQQVLINLLNNASDSLEGVKNPTITVSLNHFHADDAFLAHQEDTLQGHDFACITVADNGAGIKPEIVDHIFEPFFTTKDLGKGTGLGLAMSYGSIKTHGGTISVKTNYGGEHTGTSMTVYLPLVTEQPQAELSHLEGEIIEGNGETILLVDDNKTVLETASDVLDGLGYQILTAYDGENAVAIYKEHQDDIDLIILDIVMPKLNGPDALQIIKSINPKVKAIFATGYDQVTAKDSPHQLIKEKVISKPFAIEKLSHVIHDQLHKASSDT